MVAKISASNTLYGALAYNQIKVDENHAKVIFANKMIENADGHFDIKTCLRSFEPYLLANNRTEKPVLHISINPDPKDTLSDEQLSEIAQIYMQKMGYGNQPFIVYKHEDIERKHIHIVSLRVDENGRKINDKFEHRRSMDACRKLEQKYGLIPADQKQRKDGLPLKKVDYEKGDIKHQLANVIRPIAGGWYFQSLKEYKALLSIYNIGVEEVKTPKGKLYGDSRDLEVGYEVSGLAYSALNIKGEKVGNPLKSSLFGKEAGIEALEKRIAKSTEVIKEKGLKERSKKVIADVMRTTNNRTDFEKALEKQGISVLFRENEQGRIYGATFIDHEQKCVFNGSRLGKEFSANVFNDKFSLTHDLQDYKNSMNAGLESGKSFNQENHGLDLGGIFDLFTSEGSGSDDIEEQNLIRQMKKKRKKQRRL